MKNQIKIQAYSLTIGLSLILAILLIFFLNITDNSTAKEVAFIESPSPYKEAQKYSFRPKGNLEYAENDRQNLIAKVDETSIQVYSKEDSKDGLRVALNQVSVNGEKINSKVSIEKKVDGNTLEFEHNKALTIQYKNDRKGYRQNFIVNEGPTDSVSFKVELAVQSGFTPIQMDDRNIVFNNPYERNEYITYKDLFVFDANGKELEAYMEVADLDVANGKYIVSLIADGTDITYPLTIDPLIAANWVVNGAADSTALGYSVAGAGDVNGDGFNDIVVGVPQHSFGMTAEGGKVQVYLGSATGLLTVPQIEIEGTQLGQQMGYSVASAGDVNDDGFNDIIVGSYLYDFSLDIDPATSGVDTLPNNEDRDEGAFYIFYGSITGITTINADTVVGTVDTMRLGNAVSGIEDVNNDGFDDVLVGGYQYSNTLSGQGIAYIYEGSATGLNTTPIWSREGVKENEQFGYAVSGAGNVNGDNASDFVVGAPSWFAGVDTLQGKAYAFHGVDGGVPSTAPSWQGQGAHRGARFGISVSSAGDVNNDGFDDIVIGADRYTSTFQQDTTNNVGNGGAFVYHGSGAGLSTNADFIFESTEIASGFGNSVSDAGDVNGDGFGDIIVGAPTLSSDEFLGMGASYALYGSGSGLSAIDWFVSSDISQAFYGNSVTGLGDTNGDGVDDVAIGAANMNMVTGAAYGFLGNDPCGLPQYDSNPVFVTFPQDITVDNDQGECGAIVTYDMPTFDDNCPGTTIAMTSGFASGDQFPVGTTSVSFTITNVGGMTASRSFDVTVLDVEDPTLPGDCGTTIFVNAGPNGIEGVVNYTVPVFMDNCSFVVTREPGSIASGSTQTLGAYDVVHRATDSSGNFSFCTFTVVILDTNNPNASCNAVPIMATKKEIVPIIEANREVRNTRQLGSDLFSGSNMGNSLIFKIIEGAIGIDIPDWIEKLLGVGGLGVNLAFAGVNVGITPGLNMDYGTYNRIVGVDSATVDVNYPVKICATHPSAEFFGCKDTITIATSTEVAPGAKLEVDPGVLQQEIGVFAQNLRVEFAFFLSAYACIGIPNPTPFGPSCLGYRTSYDKTWNLFEPIQIWDGSVPGVSPDGNYPILVTCDNLFEQNASFINVAECATSTNVPNMLGTIADVFASTLGVDGVSYDNGKDEVTIEIPSLLAGLSPVPIPEFDFSFGRLTKKDLGTSSVVGDRLVVSGKENNFSKFRVDILSVVDYVIYALSGGASDAPPCGLGLGQTIDIGCGLITLDIADLNVSLRSTLEGNFSYDPEVTIASIDLGMDMNWLVVETGATGFGSIIPNVKAGHMLKLEIPDNINEAFNIDNQYQITGDLKVTTQKQVNMDFGIKALEFGGNLFGGNVFTLLCVDPLATIPGTKTQIQNFDIPIEVPDAAGSFVLVPDMTPPVVTCNDTTVYLNQDGFAFLNAETAFESGFDLPIGGTGMVRIIDVYPDTIFCSDYPQTIGYLVTDDDNCNLDTCEFIVTVLDTIRPQMGCIDIVAGIGENGTYFIDADEIAIGLTDNCRDLEVEVTPQLLTCEDVGFDREVTIMVTDIAGNTNSCTATVTVVDTMELLLECPYLLSYPMTRNTIPGACIYIANNEEFRPTLIAPDCETVISYELTGSTVLSGLSNVGGIGFNLGTTLITYTATDASGNSTQCSFEVIVEDNELPTIVCPMDVTISTNEDAAGDYNCTTDHTWDHSTPLDNCTIIAYDVEYIDPDGAVTNMDLIQRYRNNDLSETRNFALGTTTINYTAIDTMDNEVMCTYLVTVEDDELPMIFCEEIAATQTFALSAAVNIEPNDISIATIDVATSAIITDFNITSLVGMGMDMERLSFSITSPTGTTVQLFGTTCPATADFDLQLDDEAATSIALVSCEPLGGGLSYMPTEALSAFDGEDSQGLWTLTITSSDMLSCGVLNSFDIEIEGNNFDGNVNRLQVVTDPGMCTYTVNDAAFDPRFIDNCEGPFITQNTFLAPFDNSLQGAEFPIGETPVTWTVTDPNGNITTCDIIVEVIDNIAPIFVNCPITDVVQNAEIGECTAFVNFADLTATDNCGDVTVTQTDVTGLSTGSAFPVGLTIIEYTAEDSAGNTSMCSVRVIVNDTQVGVFSCSEDVERQNDPWECSAVVLGIPPVQVEDNCLDNISFDYQIEYPAGSGIIVASGVEDASGEVFDQGVSTVYYTMHNEPILLITEVTQELMAAEGGMDINTYNTFTNDDYIEVTNLGPANYNVSGLIIERFGATFNDVFEIPNTTIIPSGETLVLHFGNGQDDEANLFFNLPCALDLESDASAGYVISFKNRAIDVVATNGFDPVGQSTTAVISADDWTGMTGDSDNTGGVLRRFSYDNDKGSDWLIATNCNALTIGSINPEVEAYMSNGTTTALQSIETEIVQCSFNVTINDLEPPMCMQRLDPSIYMGDPVIAMAGECNQSIIIIPETDDCILTEINVSIQGEISQSENTVISVISPQGDTLILYDRLCTGPATLDLTFDDESSNDINVLCASGAWEDSVRPQTEMLMKFYTSKLAGDWTLFIDVDPMSAAIADITSWSIESTCMVDYDMANVEIENDLGNCGAEFTWIHPFTVDNCLVSAISVDYLSDDPSLDVPDGSILVDNFEKGGFEVTETFSVGVTTVQYTLTDQSGNVSQCEFDVVVLDTENPIITSCPTDILVGLEGGECTEVVHYVVEAEDNCEVASIVGTPPSGSFFDIGTTAVEVVVTDLAGNTSVCLFDVILFEFDPESNVFACNNAINMSLDSNCEAVINADAILEGDNYGCYDDYCISVTTLTGAPHNNYFDATDINQTFNVTVSDCSGDIEYSCWGTVTIEEKFNPEIECPSDVTIFCNQDSEEIDTLTNLLITGEAMLLNCEPGAEITYEDVTTDFGQCSNPRMLITRTWIVIDADGNQAQCDQQISVAAVDYASIIFPEDLDFDTALECEDVTADDNLLSPENTGYPTLDGKNITEAGALCMISKNVSDEIYDICNGSYEILRTWKLRNMCEPLSFTNPLTHTQIIKVLDTTGPKFVTCPADTIMSVDPWSCAGQGFLAIPESIGDLCGDVTFDAKIYGGGRLDIIGTVANDSLQVYASNMRIGDHRIEYRATDDCGNISYCSFIVTVLDITPPVVVAKQNVIINLATNGDPETGVAKLFANSVDQGSYDGCTEVYIEIRREVDNCGILGNTTFNDDGHPSDGSSNPNVNNYDPDGGQHVKFCCDDIPLGEDSAIEKVILRVWDDANGTGFFGDGIDLNGDNDTLDPGEHDNYNESWINVTLEQKNIPSLACPPDVTLACDMDYTDPTLRGAAVASSLCGSESIEVTYTPQLDACGLGFIIATYSVSSAPDVTCNQRITLENTYPVFAETDISYPRDLPTNPTGQITCQDDIPYDAPTWTASPCDFIGYLEEVDTFFFELDTNTGLPSDACFKIVRSFTVIDWCLYDATNGEEGQYFGNQTIKITDRVAPTLLGCESKVFVVDDNEDSNGNGITCERLSTTLTNVASDEGDCASDWLKWQILVDTWGDGNIDYEFSSFLPTNDSNINNDTNQNGINDRYVSPTQSDEEVAIIVTELLPASNNIHKVYWTVTDGCGNVASCETEFIVEDKKAPTPYCVSISSAPMPSTNSVELWAIDYDLGATDNCTQQENLRFTFSSTLPENDPDYNPDLRSSAMTFTAPNDCGTQPINVYVFDEAGNFDFCTVTLLLSGEGCPENNNRVIAGSTITEEGNGIANAQVILDANISEYPMTQMTIESGGFAFAENPDGIDYSLSVQKNDYHTNGVSTLDLVLIQRHVVGFEEFDSPYKVIAADITNDQNVSAQDIVELRKVVLGIQAEFINNSSWRFVDASQQFSDILDPFPLDEDREIDNLSTEMIQENFVAVKIGDVNASATYNVDGATAEVRSNESIQFEIEEKFVKSGESITVVFSSSEFKDILGFQGTFELDGLIYEDAKPNSLSFTESNIGQIDPNHITVSWSSNSMKSSDTNALFSFNMKAIKDGYLSNMIKLSDQVISTEIYQGSNYTVKGIELTVRSERELAAEAQLMQNEPNPFKVKTKIAFNLPVKSMIKLSIVDVTGKVLRLIEGEYEAGLNSIVLQSTDLGVSGVLYYTLETEGFSETKKMILID